jgi:hypothetical protein
MNDNDRKYWMKHSKKDDIVIHDLWHDPTMKESKIVELRVLSIETDEGLVQWADVLYIKTKENDPEYFL